METLTTAAKAARMITALQTERQHLRLSHAAETKSGHPRDNAVLERAIDEALRLGTADGFARMFDSVMSIR